VNGSGNSGPGPKEQGQKSLIRRRAKRADKARPSMLSIQKDLLDQSYYSLSESPESPPLQVARKTKSQVNFSSTTMTSMSAQSFSFSSSIVMTSQSSSNYCFYKTAMEKRQEQEFCKNITEILPGKLFVGALENLNDKEYFKNHNITTVISAMGSFPAKEFNLPETVTQHEKITVRDKADADISQYFEKVNNIIDLNFDINKGGTLIHCHSGISRSVTFCIAYLLKCGLFRTLNGAANRITELRPISSPNLGFLGQLSMYLKKIVLEKEGGSDDSGMDSQ